MLEKLTNNLKFSALTENERNRGILGRLYGPVASCVVPTRNGRYYTDDVWETVFDTPIVKEMFNNGGLPGELDHPVDRSETDSSRIAIMMPEPPKKDSKGELEGYFDILDTPCGKIAYQLAKYGFRFGISSRGEGDVTESYDGSEVVDADTYTLHAFDLVLLPACESARMTFTESLNTKKNLDESLLSEISNSSDEDKKLMLESLKSLDVESKGYVNESLGNKTLYKALNEALDSAKSDDRKVMTETLDRIGVNYKDSSNKGEEDVNQTLEEAVDDGASLVKDLQQALKNNAELSKKVTELQEKLSVCYAKDVKNEEQVTKLKNSVVALSESVKRNASVHKQVASLNEQLEGVKAELDEKTRLCNSLNVKLSHIQSNRTKLNESIDAKANKINDLVSRNTSLKEELESIKSKSKDELASLTEELNSLKADSKVKNSQYAKKLATANSLVEKYRKTAETAVNHYIESKAKQLGVKAVEIKNKLEENYSFEDIDKVCDSLRSYKMNMNKLPFTLGNNISRVAMNESKQTKRFENPDDDVFNDDFIKEILNS